MRVDSARESKMVAGEAISAGNRYIFPIYRIESFMVIGSFLAELKPKGVLNVERDQVFYTPIDDDQVPLDELFDSISGLEDLIAELKGSLQS
ncbi:MAG: hypothetical protein ACLFVX_04675 [Archaeoglobaceae archaeon]